MAKKVKKEQQPEEVDVKQAVREYSHDTKMLDFGVV